MDKKIVEKIKKCLRLSASSNPHEAATAMRQAQKLMEKYGVSASDIELSKIESSLTKAGNTKCLPAYLLQLAHMINAAFGTTVIMESTGAWQRWESHLRFIGVGSQAELAAYAFDVLRRQLTRDRNEYLSSLKRLKRTTKTRRADLFALAWVEEANKKIVAVTVPSAQGELIQKWKQQHYQRDLGTAKPRTHAFKGRDYDAALHGAAAGRNAQINPGVTTPHAPVELEGHL